MTVDELKIKIREYEYDMSSYYKNSLLGMPRDHFLYLLGTLWDSVSVSGAKRRHQYKMMLADLDALKDQLNPKEYYGLKLRIKTAYED